ncbi:hypothetical protein COOONC_21099 [Cooperia oncophora]
MVGPRGLETERFYFSENEKVVALGKFAAAGIASILESYNVTSECEKITMYKVFIVQEYKLDNIRDIGHHFYEIIFSLALPAYGKFKTQIREDQHGKFELAGDYYDRLDKYGDKGDCMKSSQLKKFCTCKTPTTTTAESTSSLPIFSRSLPRETSQSQLVNKTESLSSQLHPSKTSQPTFVNRTEPFPPHPSKTSTHPRETSEFEFVNKTKGLSSQPYPSKTSLLPGKDSESTFGNNTNSHPKRSTSPHR